MIVKAPTVLPPHRVITRTPSDVRSLQEWVEMAPFEVVVSSGYRTVAGTFHNGTPVPDMELRFWFNDAEQAAEFEKLFGVIHG